MNDKTKYAEEEVTEQLENMASRFQEQRTGHAPKSVSVDLSNDTLVLTLNGALTKAEKEMARSPDGAAQVQEFHRQLFRVSAEEMIKEISRLTGRHVREAATEIVSDAVVIAHSFTLDVVVQVFLLAQENESESKSHLGGMADGGGPG